jgi:hypothetical protein
MQFLQEFKLTLQKAIQSGLIPEARSMVQSFHRTGAPYDAQIYYLEAALCYYEAHYPLALLFARLGYERFPDFEPFEELLALLSDTEQEWDHYLPCPTFDCTFLNQKLRIVIYENVSELMDYTARQFHNAFTLLGHEVMIFDHKDFTASSKELLSFADQGIDFVLLFNNAGSQITTTNGQNIWDLLGVTCFDYLFDHPLYYKDDLTRLPRCGVVTCVDRNHVRFIQRFHPNIREVFYFPLGGEYLPLPQAVPWEDRKIDVLYVGSLKNVKDAPQNALSQYLTDYLIAHPSCTTEAAFERYLSALLSSQAAPDRENLSLEDVEELSAKVSSDIIDMDSETPSVPVPEKLLWDVLWKYRFVDMSVNAYYREKMIAMLVNSGIPVTVYGYGWEQTDFFHNPCFHYGKTIDQTECIQKMHQSKIVLNSMPWFKNGTHDRIFNAMLSHAVCVTDDSVYLKETFTDQKELVYYQLDAIDKLPEIVKKLLDNPANAIEIAENGYQAAILKHTWENRAMELVKKYHHLSSAN